MGPVGPAFEAHNGLDFGGVLFLLPALILQGVLAIKETHKLKPGYYDIESIILTLAFMALCRIENPEQLKQHKPGELGRLIGLDRVPELKCLRQKINQLVAQNQGKKLNEKLVKQWLPENDDILLYADGHVSIYNGYMANLPVKYVSRQKLCLSANTDFWLNDQGGLPLLVFTGDLSEKLQHAIESNLITQLVHSKAIAIADEISESTPAVCTIIFDREAYEPAFFMRLWTKYRIAVITYRKNVKNQWDNESFKSQTVTTEGKSETMQLCEQQTELGGHMFREIRRLSPTGHQTAVITTHPLLSFNTVAGSMFNRWTQENFFKYMRSDFSFDHIYTYGAEEVDEQREVVNPQYRRINYQVKKEKEKQQRLKAKLMQELEKNIDTDLDNMGIGLKKNSRLVEDIKEKQQLINTLIEDRRKITPKIKLKDMPEGKRYNKLKTENRLFIHIIKMICYRAESAMANQVAQYFNRADDEKRMLIKQIIQTKANVYPDYKNKTLTVTLHSLSKPQYNKIAAHLTVLLNQTETVFPGTDLTLIFKIQ